MQLSSGFTYFHQNRIGWCKWYVSNIHKHVLGLWLTNSGHMSILNEYEQKMKMTLVSLSTVSYGCICVDVTVMLNKRYGEDSNNKT